MLFNYQALQQYVDWSGSLEELCDLLTGLGLEVEDVRALAPELRHLPVGRILTREPHPNADRLTLCSVDTGADALHQIVCGATNHRVGDKVVVALPGDVLPGDFKIEARKLRGVESAGMMCSERELELSDEHAGIIILPEEAETGTPAWPYLTQVELNITPNRPDCLGWIGIAREIAAATGVPLKRPHPAVSVEGSEAIPIVSEDPEGCPRYLGQIIRGVTIGPSPDWLQQALKQVDLEPICNVVDITNYVLMETGHPLHAFDLQQLRGPEILVRRARAGEEFKPLAGEPVTLTEENLVIADSSRAVALAGVMGGLESAVSEGTTDLLIECAFFDPPRIRRSGRLAGISSDSSFRFERGVDPYGLEAALARCVALIVDLAGGAAMSPVLAAESKDAIPSLRSVCLRPEKASERLGVTVSPDRQSEILGSLGCRVEETPEGQFKVTVPGFRPDLAREIDLIEEICRVYGYNSIPSTPPELPTQVGRVHPAFSLERRLTDHLIERGYIEARCYSYVAPDFGARLQLSEDHPLRHAVQVVNPINREAMSLRTTLLPNLLDVLRWNVQHGERDLKCFEFGRVYLPDTGNILGCERHALGIVWLGHERKHWDAPETEYSFFTAKGAGEALLRELGVVGFELRPYESPYLHPGQCAEWVCGEAHLGVLGRLHPQVTAAHDLPVDPYVAEFDVEAIAALMAGDPPRITAPSAFPSIRRDLSLTVPVSVSAKELMELIRSADIPLLEGLELFDRYVGEQVGEGAQSLGFRLTYRSSERTLTEEEVTPLHAQLLEDLHRQLGAVQRGSEVRT